MITINKSRLQPRGEFSRLCLLTMGAHIPRVIFGLIPWLLSLVSKADNDDYKRHLLAPVMSLAVAISSTDNVGLLIVGVGSAGPRQQEAKAG